jgi:hypothetical protein
MKLKGVSYDVGRVMGGNWRPDYDPVIVKQELRIIRDDLHCNAVRICGLDIHRLITSAERHWNWGSWFGFPQKCGTKVRLKRWIT